MLRAKYETHQEKVETTWLFDTVADAHAMPGLRVWEQLGEPTLQPTRHMNRILEPHVKCLSQVSLEE